MAGQMFKMIKHKHKQTPDTEKPIDFDKGVFQMCPICKYHYLSLKTHIWNNHKGEDYKKWKKENCDQR
jgi:hypothetical protein